MFNQSKDRETSQNKIILYSFHLGWITLLAIIVLFMRVWIKSGNIDKELNALEAAETDQLSQEIPISKILKPLKSPSPDIYSSNNIFVPLYRSFYIGKNRTLKSLVATLSIHNTSFDSPLIINNLVYFDGNGNETKTIFKTPHLLPARATADFYIDHVNPDYAPVTSAFVGWIGESSIPPPLVEAVIVGQYGTKSFSVISRGVSTSCCKQLEVDPTKFVN